MIVNVCASSISREPIFHTTYYTTYYYTEKRSPFSSTKSSDVRELKEPLIAKTPLSEKLKTKWQKLMGKLRMLIAMKFAKFS
ncbi:unnamed protein product [Cylicocyclus nassatus]|uniref:Uncharacterized protein n=1 Tax=Cylicocyclus nassatus TaxID=53992 RepID=A0AA36GGD8_CYLNA|nr:unnamed protein product [Cylicocyclus nassatus]